MASPVAASVTSSGISAPSYADVLAYLKAQYASIFGADIYLGNDSQDGQFLGIIAAAINDCNAAAVAAYNSFSPSTAQGNGLSRSVKINGLTRQVATNSSVNLTLVGQAGVTITSGVASDSSGNLWLLPSTVVIPPSGTITVTATAQAPGAIAAQVGAITTISTPVYGWQSVVNTSAATPGASVETDAALRVRQAASTSLPSLSVLSGIVAAVNSISGVAQVVPYENDTNATDANGLPPKSISLVVNGGDINLIASAIATKKTPGSGTYGTTAATVTDPATGLISTVRFFRPSVVPIAVSITLHALSGYTTSVAAEIQAAVAAYINGLAIGKPVMVTRLYVPAQLNGAADALTFEIVTLLASAKPGTPGPSDIAIAFNQMATCQASDVTITVV